jgi:UDP-N-acetylmuramate--alanine ligase
MAQLNKSRFHFIGVGGIGMCGIAEILHLMGAQVTGSDMSENSNTKRLSKMGLKIFKGHSAGNVKNASVVVYSSAVQSDNVEYQEAQILKIPLIARAEALAEVMRLKRGVAIAGTHGKTTTTSLVASVFLEAHLHPTIAVGGRLSMIDSTAQLGGGEWFIAEADESDGSFNKLNPEISVITNIDSDHMDYYKNFENLKLAFAEFANRIPFYGQLIACGDDAGIRQCLSNYKKRVLYYGFNSNNNLQISGGPGTYFFKLIDQQIEKNLGEIKLKLPGRHNALNSAAALAVGLNAGIDFAVIKRALENFSGVDRRFELKEIVNSVHIYDDYGHHPTEVRATLQAFKEKFPKNRLAVYFQPHRYSRTKDCWLDFQNSFDLADQVFMGPIYAAGEEAIEGISSEQLVLEIQNKNPHKKNSVLNCSSRSEALSDVLKYLKPDDVFVTLGAGDGWKLGLDVIANLKKR